MGPKTKSGSALDKPIPPPPSASPRSGKRIKARREVPLPPHVSRSVAPSSSSSGRGGALAGKSRLTYVRRKSSAGPSSRAGDASDDSSALSSTASDASEVDVASGSSSLDEGRNSFWSSVHDLPLAVVVKQIAAPAAAELNPGEGARNEGVHDAVLLQETELDPEAVTAMAEKCESGGDDWLDGFLESGGVVLLGVRLSQQVRVLETSSSSDTDRAQAVLSALILLVEKVASSDAGLDVLAHSDEVAGGLSRVLVLRRFRFWYTLRVLTLIRILISRSSNRTAVRTRFASALTARSGGNDALFALMENKDTPLDVLLILIRIILVVFRTSSTVFWSHSSWTHILVLLRTRAAQAQESDLAVSLAEIESRVESTHVESKPDQYKWY